MASSSALDGLADLVLTPAKAPTTLLGLPAEIRKSIWQEVISINTIEACRLNPPSSNKCTHHISLPFLGALLVNRQMNNEISCTIPSEPQTLAQLNVNVRQAQCAAIIDYHCDFLKKFKTVVSYLDQTQSRLDAELGDIEYGADVMLAVEDAYWKIYEGESLLYEPHYAWDVLEVDRRIVKSKKARKRLLGEDESRQNMGFHRLIVMTDKGLEIATTKTKVNLTLRRKPRELAF